MVHGSMVLRRSRCRSRSRAGTRVLALQELRRSLPTRRLRVQYVRRAARRARGRTVTTFYKVPCRDCARKCLVPKDAAQRFADGESFMICDHCVEKLIGSS